MKQQALEKMLEEMNAAHSPAEDAIHNWLCDQTEDNELMAGICKDGKSIKQAMDYCMSQARKSANGANSAMVDDATVYGWVREYFVSDKVKIERTDGKVAVSKTSRQKIVPKLKQEKVKKVESAKGDEQMSLFDFLE